VRRLVATLLTIGTFGTVLVLGQLHALRHSYQYVGQARLAWSLVYAGGLCLGAYAVGLPDLPRSRRSRWLSALAALTLVTLAMSAAQLLLGTLLLPRFVVFGSAALLLPGYALCATVASDGRRLHEERDRVLVVAAPDAVEDLSLELDGQPERFARIVASVEAGAVGVGTLLEIAATSRVTVVVLDRTAQADETVLGQVAQLHLAGTRVRTLSLFYEEWLGKLPVSELERVSLLFDVGEIHRAHYVRAKRVVDLAFGCAGLVVLALVAPAVVIGNALGNRGPLLYRQERVGRDGRPFSMVKFRSMRTPTLDGEPSLWTTVGDPRITSFGRLLRRSHLDELPQVWNVLRGDLSIVGPRPEQGHYVDELRGKLPFYDLRHIVRPGLTGWAQVKYPYGADLEDAREKLQYEFFYLRRQSVGLDLRIIGRTLRAVLRRDGR
jgi:lipopolysaccharide/colanic/teichoic acid biosynthesis glycosyltransferase